jgi:hypothetical protein
MKVRRRLIRSMLFMIVLFWADLDCYSNNALTNL